MSKIFVKLKDKGGSFHDQSQDVFLGGSKISAEVDKTPKVNASIKGGALVEITDTEHKSLQPKEEVPTKKSEKAATKKVAEGGGEKGADAGEGAPGTDEATNYDDMTRADLDAELAKRPHLDPEAVKKATTNAKIAALLKEDDEAAASANK